MGTTTGSLSITVFSQGAVSLKDVHMTKDNTHHAFPLCYSQQIHGMLATVDKWLMFDYLTNKLRLEFNVPKSVIVSFAKHNVYADQQHNWPAFTEEQLGYA